MHMNHQDYTEITFNGVCGRDEFRRVHVAEKVINLLTASIDLSPWLLMAIGEQARQSFATSS